MPTEESLNKFIQSWINFECVDVRRVLSAALGEYWNLIKAMAWSWQHKSPSLNLEIFNQGEWNLMMTTQKKNEKKIPSILLVAHQKKTLELPVRERRKKIPERWTPPGWHGQSLHFRNDPCLLKPQTDVKTGKHGDRYPFSTISTLLRFPLGVEPFIKWLGPIAVLQTHQVILIIKESKWVFVVDSLAPHCEPKTGNEGSSASGFGGLVWSVKCLF